MAANPDKNPLPLSETLRDLALLRASEVDLVKVLRSSSEPLARETSDVAESRAGDAEIGASVEKSYEFVRDARAVIKVLNRGDVESQGARVEDLRSKLEDVLEGLNGQP
ncbi:hypothetical protein GLOTRDRAFT_120642 [Gloeophyllum trabeum ATCC 11539]|uniref:Uncharacterized protein n=1 Tax=Gloeophyllum trabeum (strain ATCC 11539 / FP-39264 / Madison 617) TaxID=670483 RepID=S7RSA0_GLOTA|nr:uncharacterized protein GLOTRDRAFT_120642 [Gloeophyllum trabeum ATCC 11539]EPQ57485.1 hypothetical protein GLOTRDRAFT_120642 [Gloeophyllum trabeum ATCC 11539]